MSRERESEIIQSTIKEEGWPIGESMSTPQIYQRYESIRRNSNQASMPKVFRKMDCFEVKTSEPGAHKLNMYKRSAPPGKICEGCYFNSPSPSKKGRRSSCQLMESST